MSLSPEHLASVVVNVWQTHWPVNWPEYLQSMCFYVRQINVMALVAVGVDVAVDAVGAAVGVVVDVVVANADAGVAAATLLHATEFGAVERLKLVFSVDTAAAVEAAAVQ